MRAFCDSGISIVQQKGEPIAPVEQSVPLFVEIDLILSLRLSRLAAGAWRRRVVACGGCVAAASLLARLRVLAARVGGGGAASASSRAIA